MDPGYYSEKEMNLLGSKLTREAIDDQSRRTFYVDTGKMEPEAAQEFVRTMIERFKIKPKFDANEVAEALVSMKFSPEISERAKAAMDSILVDGTYCFEKPHAK
jgi:polyhydroxyalkanoate synthesis regulator phasin